MRLTRPIIKQAVWVIDIFMFSKRYSDQMIY